MLRRAPFRRPFAPVVLVFALLGATPLACRRGDPDRHSGVTAASSANDSTTRGARLPAKPWIPAAIAHGGVGSAPRLADGCQAAVDAALKVIEAGGEARDAAVAGVVVLEDDPRFNAGTGAVVRLDGRSIQMDASLMTSDGRFGAVTGVERVKNPVRVARAVMDTPHLLFQGDGATRFARTLGMPDYNPTTAERRESAKLVQRRLLAHDPTLGEVWNRFDWRARWNFETPIDEAGLAAPDALPTAGGDAGHDTVGVAVRTADGRFAVALSTGGTSVAMRGRVGDVPVLGAGLYAGSFGAAAATGTGERIIEAGLARVVHEELTRGVPAAEAASHAVERIRGRGDIGIIVIDANTLSAAADRPMAWAARALGSSTWSLPDGARR